MATVPPITVPLRAEWDEETLAALAKALTPLIIAEIWRADRLNGHVLP